MESFDINCLNAVLSFAFTALINDSPASLGVDCLTAAVLVAVSVLVCVVVAVFPALVVLVLEVSVEAPPHAAKVSAKAQIAIKINFDNFIIFLP
jgi:hypothetical protein